MPNIKFSYRYRDSGNYKKFVFVIFANPNNIKLSELDALIKSRLIDDTYFYAEEWKRPELFTDYIDFKIDPSWHEFESVEYTDESSNTPLDLSGFINVIKLTNWRW